MSRAFIKEDANEEQWPQRRPPSGPNYVTPQGLELLRQKVQVLSEHSGDRSAEERGELRYWQERLGSAVLVDNSLKPPPDIRFGAWVEAKDGEGRTRVFHIVGQDEAEPGGDLIAWDSVLARQLIGHGRGERVPWLDGDLERELLIVSVRYAEGGGPPP